MDADLKTVNLYLPKHISFLRHKIFKIQMNIKAMKNEIKIFHYNPNTKDYTNKNFAYSTLSEIAGDGLMKKRLVIK